ncbi:hypothetical protein [Nonomuraea sp. NPDC046570]|uniref:hypothetical protein n=1 Tax=Nonomuraea sp. NPDC046570 TaxID=3155255 RepID=UPI003410BC39
MEIQPSEPEGAAVGAAANVVMLGIAARNRTPISFWQFTRYGPLATLVTIALLPVSARQKPGTTRSPAQARKV